MTQEPPIPEHIDITAGMSSLMIRRSWRTWKVVPLALFAVVWDAFLVVWYSLACSKGGTPVLALVFPILHVAVGVGITYYVISSLLNTTKIEISADRVSVKTKPLTWFSDREVNTAEIRGTRIKYSYSNNHVATYEIRYRTPDNREKKLIGGLNDDQAEYIDFQLRKTLGLKEEEEAEEAED